MPDNQIPSPNKATITITKVMSITLAIAGLHHGFFEVLQGNKNTGGFGIHSIGEQQQFWEYGTDDAFTLIPNFLVTGIMAMITSLVIIIWSVNYMKRKNSSTIFLLLFLLLTLVGGGIGHIVFFLSVWLYSRNIHSELKGWKKIMGSKTRLLVKNSWPFLLAISSLCFLVGLEISVFGYVPNVSDPDEIFAICWAFLGLSLITLQLTYIAGFAYDIEIRKREYVF